MQDQLGDVERICRGCNLSVEEDNGVVVAFGSTLWHVDCFKCAKCNNRVMTETNLLLLSDGSPICSDCSYNCTVCRNPILDEAIMTDGEAFHAKCFVCRVCHQPIESLSSPLMFARTKNGVYCMPCHNTRVQKSRRHIEKKKAIAVANARENGTVSGSSSTSRRDRYAANFHQQNGLDSPYFDSPTITPSATELGQRAAAAPVTTLPSVFPPTPRRPDLPPDTPQQGPVLTISPVQHSMTEPTSHADKDTLASRPEAVQRSRTETLPVPSLTQPATEPKHRASLDNPSRTGLRPSTSSGAASGVAGLNIPTQTSKAKKRHSINPALGPIDFTKAVSDIANDAQQAENGSQGRQTPSDSLYYSPSTSPQSVPSKALAVEPPTDAGRSADPEESTPSRSVANRRINGPRPPPLDQVPLRQRSQSDRPMTADTQAINGSPSTPQRHLSPLGSARSDKGYFPHSSNDPSDEKMSSSTVGARTALSPKSPQHLQRRSPDNSRSGSPAFKPDVPHSVESGTDLDTDLSPEADSEAEAPPALPPKERQASIDTDGESFEGSDVAKMYATMTDPNVDSPSPPSSPECVPAERTSRTFIVPALPPIRFSMTETDFSEILHSMNEQASHVRRHSATMPPIAETSLPSPASLTTLTNPAPASGHTERKTQPGTAMNHSSGPAARDHTSNGIVPSQHTIPPIQRSVSGTSRRSEESRRVSSSSLSRHGSTRSKHSRKDSTGSAPRENETWLSDTRITVTAPDAPAPRPAIVRQNPSDLVTRRLREALDDANERGVSTVKVDRDFLQAILTTLESSFELQSEMKSKLDAIKRASRQALDGLTVAYEEYEQELASRRAAEAELSRMKVLVHNQVARISSLSGEQRQKETMEKMMKGMLESVSDLESDLSRLKVERDMVLTEVEELSAMKKQGNSVAAETREAKLSRSISTRLDTLKGQYRRDLEPLKQQREALKREVAELKEARDIFLEETAALNARNEELARLNAQHNRTAQDNPKPALLDRRPSEDAQQTPNRSNTSLLSTPSRSNAASPDHTEMSTPMRKGRNFNLFKPIKDHLPASGLVRSREHTFQQLSLLRVSRCDHCNDKMWGTQLRCSNCNFACHARCVQNVVAHCPPTGSSIPSGPLPPSMFGRPLLDQIQDDSKETKRLVPIIVEKCIEAVEAHGLDYEGIYRKTGGTAQCRKITQLFETGSYSSFDLCDTDEFNDISSVTSVLKNYLRELPVPLLTYSLHPDFVSAVKLPDPAAKSSSLSKVINTLPHEHYNTLRSLMLHLNRVSTKCDENRMNARNLGVVFGPTLMKGPDPSQQYSDMAEKAITVELLIEHAPMLFSKPILQA